MILRAVVRNWDLKLVALAMAFALWFFVASTDRSQVTLAAPVEYEGLDAGLVLVGGPREVDVQVHAPRWALARLTPNVLRVRVDLTTAGEGESIIRLSPGEVRPPPDVAVTRITPGWLRVTLATATQKSLRVVPQLRGTPAPQHSVHRVTVEPAAVQVKGPRSTIEARTSIETVPVDVTGGRESLTQTVGLVLPDLVYLTQDRTVQVTVDIRPELRSGRKGPSP